MPTPFRRPITRPIAFYRTIRFAIASSLIATHASAQMPAVVPDEIIESLLRDKIVVMQELRPEGALEGALTIGYVIFDLPRDRVYELLTQTERQIEFRSELTSITRHRMSAKGPVDEQRMKIMFRRYVYRLKFEFDPERHHIQWSLDQSFDNDFRRVRGSWDLYALEDGRTLGRTGASVDVGPGVPVFLQDWLTRKNLSKSMERVQRWVNSGGHDRQ